MNTPTFLALPKHFSSKAIHLGSEPDRWTNNELVPPISLSTTYRQDVPINNPKFHYIRDANPMLNSFETCLASIENANYCLAVSSGMAAHNLALSLLEAGDHVVTQNDLYHGIFTAFNGLHKKNINVDFVDATETSNIVAKLKKCTKLVWLETPTNPLMKVVDLKATVKAVRHKCPDATIICDNTFMSPYFQQPLQLGVDIVMESCTKYIGGHSDILMGSLSMKDKTLYEQLWKARSQIGCTPSPFDCYLGIRSLKTLELRMQKHMSNALDVARFLETHPRIEKVFHPALESHPQHQLALRQCHGHSGIMSFYIRGHQLEVTERFLAELKFVPVADSLGGVESSLKIPSIMPKGALSQAEMDKQGITNGLVRLSVGLECSEDIIGDLSQALEKAFENVTE